MRRAFAAIVAASLSAAAPAPPAAPAAGPAEGGTLPGGARWAGAMPEHWNGTLLLWSRGYSPNVGSPQDAPPPLRAALLASGYALAGSDYGAGGWALEEAVPAQLATVAAFGARFGKPKRVIAWGYSMGGLVTTALAEHRPAQVDGAAAFCASIGGAVGMMNMALDGAAAFKILLAPQSDLRLVAIDDDAANAKRAATILAAAMEAPQGRARIALAGVLAGLPGWTVPTDAPPAATDYDAQVRQMAQAFVAGIFLPRVDQEKRAGGPFSWTTGVDFRAQLALSGRRALVEALYAKAGLDLDRDLARLNGAERIAAKPAAVRYMTDHYTPNARPALPLLTVQAIGDGMTSPSLQRAYMEAARGRDVRNLWTRQAGHCRFTPETVMTGIRFVEARLDRGRWPQSPAGFIAYTPPPMLRPCVRGGRCR